MTNPEKRKHRFFWFDRRNPSMQLTSSPSWRFFNGKLILLVNSVLVVETMTSRRKVGKWKKEFQKTQNKLKEFVLFIGFTYHV